MHSPDQREILSRCTMLMTFQNHLFTLEIKVNLVERELLNHFAQFVQPEPPVVRSCCSRRTYAFIYESCKLLALIGQLKTVDIRPV